MDLQSLHNEAVRLRELLEHYAASESEAKIALEALTPLLNAALRYEITGPIRDVPCDYYFHEGNLRKHRELEEAYSIFSVRLLGYNVEVAKRFDETMKSGTVTREEAISNNPFLSRGLSFWGYLKQKFNQLR